MLKPKFARELLNRYEELLNSKQAVIESDPYYNDDFKAVIPNILKALKDIANPHGEHHQESQQFLETEFVNNFYYFADNKEVHEVYQAGREMLEHPDDLYVNRVSTAYGSFFGKGLYEIAFSPFLAVYRASQGDERGYTGLLTTLVFAIPLMIPTVITVLCAAVLAILAGLVSPVAFAGAAIADACVNATDEPDLQPSFA